MLPTLSLATSPCLCFLGNGGEGSRCETKWEVDLMKWCSIFLRVLEGQFHPGFLLPIRIPRWWIIAGCWVILVFERPLLWSVQSAVEFFERPTFHDGTGRRCPRRVATRLETPQR